MRPSSPLAYLTRVVAIALTVGALPAGAQTPCASVLGGVDTPLAPSAALYCMPLLPSPGIAAEGWVELNRSPGPFTVDVTRDGHQRYAPRLHLRLPELAEVAGSAEGYVAWVVAPTFFPEYRLGTVPLEGAVELGEIALDKFLVLITAEPDTTASERSGRIVMRGMSPSSRMRPADFLEFGLGSTAVQMPGMEQASSDGEGAAEGPMRMEGMGDSDWRIPPMPEGVGMLPRMMMLRPPIGPRMPGDLTEAGANPLPARPHQLIRLSDGDAFDLEATVVTREIDGHTVRMYAYNGQYPGPLLWVSKGATVTVRFTNRIDEPTTVHWHGLRLENRYDGIPGVTQDPVLPGETFVYELTFPDPGLYWYHPHMREDVQQDGGLYGNMMVRDPRGDYFGPAHREEVLMLDDLLVSDEGPVQWGRERATHGFMGRFGNRFLVNGAPGWDSQVDRGEVVRLFLTNVANTRTFNLSFIHEDGGGDAPMKIIGSDVGTYEREERVGSIVIAPAERYMAHVRFDRPGRYLLVNRVQGIDHLYGAFFPEVDTLGVVHVTDELAPRGATEAFDTERLHPWISAEIDPYREEFGRPVDRELELRLQARDLPLFMERLMAADSLYFPPVEWSGTMPRMNWWATDHEASWRLHEPSTGHTNMDIRWDFRLGEVQKIRIHSERNTLHQMQHPIHFHGQRFLVLSVNGVPNDNLVWKDTVLVPSGATVDLLLEASNPGDWMAHCHIAEHLEAGMMLGFSVR